MLKWLVTRSPSQTSADNSVTDDPLATLSRTTKKNEPIYAVSRVNPIFEEDSKSAVKETRTAELVGEQRSSPDSPPTDRESVRSSGYGSKETDSVSYKSEVHDEENLNEVNKITEQNDFDSPGTVADIRRSFEILSNSESLLNKNDKGDKVITTNPEYVKNIEVIVPVSSPLQTIIEVTTEPNCDETIQKKSSWPRVSHLAQALQRQAERIHQRREREKFKERLRNSNAHNYKHQVLRFNPLVSVVSQDERYVTEISLSPHKTNKKIYRKTKQNLVENFVNDANFQLGPHVNANSVLNRITENTEQSFQPDSLINEDTIKMMNSPEYESNFRFDDRNLPGDKNLIQTLPNFGKAIYTNFHPTLSRGTPSSHYSLGKRETSAKSLGRAKFNGANIAKDLWEKSGLKTNGRKLLVNSSSIVADNTTFGLQNESQGSLDDVDSKKTINLVENLKNNGIENLYEYNPSLTRASSSSYNLACHSYEYFTNSNKGIENLGFINDIGNSMDSLASSSQSKHSYPFQHSLTEFQKRVSDKLQAESNESGLTLARLSTDNSKYQKNNANIIKNKNYPGKAVHELRLMDNKDQFEPKGFEGSISVSPSGPSLMSKGSQEGSSNGQKNRLQIWEEFGRSYKDDTFPSYFFRHPNSKAPIFAHHDGFHHDFTLDAKRSQKIMIRSSKSKRRRKCCVGFLVLFAFLSFIGIIIGLSWFSTGGERLFGPM